VALTEARVVREGSTSVVFVSGEIDISNCDQVFAVIEPELGSDTSVLVDLSELTYMDSACLNVLLRAHRRQSEEGGTLAIRRPSLVAVRLLTVTGLEHLIDA
jgi:anti-sigma B factor antagonist